VAPVTVLEPTSETSDVQSKRTPLGPIGLSAVIPVLLVALASHVIGGDSTPADKGLTSNPPDHWINQIPADRSRKPTRR
jgi:hypothetical protein